MKEQFQEVETVLLQLAKNFWLVYPMHEAVENLSNDQFFQAGVDKSVLKMMVAGFYLTFCMFQSWTVAGVRVHIVLDAKDLRSFGYFRKGLEECGAVPSVVKVDIQAMVGILTYGDGFQLTSESDVIGINPVARSLCNALDSKVSQTYREVSFFNHKLVDCAKKPACLSGVTAFNTALASLKRRSEDILTAQNRYQKSARSEASQAQPDSNESQSVCELYAADSADCLDPEPVGRSDVLNAAIICASLGDEPVLSVQNLMANGIVDLAMMSEARKKRSMKARSGKPVRPYIEEGSIFGRKNWSNDDENGAMASGIGMDSAASRNSSGDLWNFINTADFGGSSNVGRVDNSAGNL
jgi:hypothetical protein